MNFNNIKKAVYSLYLTNIYGIKLKNSPNPSEKKKLRYEYSKKLLKSLNIKVRVKNQIDIPKGSQYLLICNHRSVIDPPILEMALGDTDIFGLWVSKKELYNSFFFGMFVRNAGCILLDREKSQMGGFFADIKKGVSEGSSIFIFPEGTRNQSKSKLSTFKDGSRIIAMKNRIPILPIHIETNADIVMKEALIDSSIEREIIVNYGEILPYKSRDNLERKYREIFGIVE